MSHPLRSLRPKGGRKQAFRWTSQQHLNAAAFVRTPFFQQLIGTAAQISEKEILGKLGSTPDELRKCLGFGELSDDAKNEAGQWISDIVDVKVARLLKTEWDDILGNEEGGGKGEKKDKRSQRSHRRAPKRKRMKPTTSTRMISLKWSNHHLKLFRLARIGVPPTMKLTPYHPQRKRKLENPNPSLTPSPNRAPSLPQPPITNMRLPSRI
jgi:hypothetical protein